MSKVPWVAPRVLQARLGSRRPPWAASAVDAVAEQREGGTATGQGQAKPRPLPLAGAELADLRARLYDHQVRDSPQRIRTRRFAVTHDNRRATPNPRLAAHLVSGRGDVQRRSHERARLSAAAPERHVGRKPSARGGSRAPIAQGEQATVQGSPSAPRAERLTRLPKDGELAPALLRPAVRKDVPASETRRRRPDVSDSRDRRRASRQLVPDRVDLAQASGRGDQTGRGQGSRAGRRGSPGGRWKGLAIWLNTSDQRYVDYFKLIHRRVQPLWRFPKGLEIRMEQGDVLVEFVLRPDGSVRRVRVRRSSGYAAFDENAVAAIRRAAPFPTVPRGLGAPLTILAPFEFANPLVR